MASILKVGDSWRALVRRKGRKSSCKTFRTKDEAQRWARELEARLDAGTMVHPTKATVASLIQAYRDLREAARPIADTSNEHYMLRHLQEGLGAVPAHGLSSAHMIGFAKARRAQGAGAYTVLMEVSKLSTVLRYAGAGLGLADVVGEARPLLNHAGLIGGGGKRERRPTDDEYARIVAALPAKMRQVVQIMVAIGLRRGEVCRLRWEDLDRDKRMVLVRDRKDPRQKKGNDQWVPLIRGSWEIVNSQPVTSGGIFPSHPQTLSKVFKATCDSLGIVDLHLHDLRHEATSQMFEQGYTIEQVALVTGHKDWRHLRTYTNLKPESLVALDAHRDRPLRPARLHIVSHRRGKS